LFPFIERGWVKAPTGARKAQPEDKLCAVRARSFTESVWIIRSRLPRSGHAVWLAQYRAKFRLGDPPPKAMIFEVIRERPLDGAAERDRTGPGSCSRQQPRILARL